VINSVEVFIKLNFPSGLLSLSNPAIFVHSNCLDPLRVCDNKSSLLLWEFEVANLRKYASIAFGETTRAYESSHAHMHRHTRAYASSHTHARLVSFVIEHHRYLVDCINHFTPDPCPLAIVTSSYRKCPCWICLTWDRVYTIPTLCYNDTWQWNKAPSNQMLQLTRLITVGKVTGRGQRREWDHPQWLTD